jgi:hypothetical protein
MGARFGKTPAEKRKQTYFPLFLIALPATGWALRSKVYWLGTVTGVLASFFLVSSISYRRCPTCRERLTLIGGEFRHCPKCGAQFESNQTQNQ